MSSIPGNSSTRATLSVGQVYSSTLTYSGDTDWYKVSLKSGLDYGFKISGDGSASALRNPDIQILNQDGNVISEKFTYSSTSVTDSVSIGTTGTYYVSVLESYGGTGAYKLSWLGNDTVVRDATTTATLGIGQTIKSAVDVSGDADWYKVSLKAGLDYGFKVSGDGSASSLQNPDIQILDQDGNVISEKFTYSSTSAVDNVSIDTTGTYYVSVLEGDHGTGAYKLSWLGNDTVVRNAATTATIGIGQTIKSAVDVSGDADWYKVSLKAGLDYGFKVSGDGSASSLQNPDIQILDRDGNVISRQFTYFSTFAVDSVSIGTTGTYYVSVLEGDGGTGAYTLSWLGNDTEARNVRTTGVLHDGMSTASAIDVAGDHDWYALSVVRGASYSVKLSGDGSASSLGRVSLALRDANGNLISSSSSSYSSATATIGFSATANKKVFLDASAYDSDDSGSYRISILSTAPTLTGTSNADAVTGGDGATTIFGYAGNDSLYGAGGNDVLVGGAGRDLLSGGSGKDAASYSDARKGVVASLDAPSRNTGDAAGDKYVSIENLIGSRFGDSLTGNSAANTLKGGAGNDVLSGGAGRDALSGDAGNDRLIGGVGADTLTGGTGADVFSVRSVRETTVSSTGRDWIADFVRADGDRLDLKSIDANTRSSGDQAFHFIGTAGFSGHAGELRYVRQSGDSYVSGDIDGDRHADFMLVVDGVSGLRAADFVL